MEEQEEEFIGVFSSKFNNINFIISGWFLLIPFYNLVLAVTSGTKGKNLYGIDLKAE